MMDSHIKSYKDENRAMQCNYHQIPNAHKMFVYIIKLHIPNCAFTKKEIICTSMKTIFSNDFWFQAMSQHVTEDTKLQSGFK